MCDEEKSQFRTKDYTSSGDDGEECLGPIREEIRTLSGLPKELAKGDGHCL